MNIVALIGNIGNDIELRSTPNGKSVCTLNLAVKDDFNKDKTHWITVVLWEKQAELASKYLRKGSKIGVTGSLQVRQYEDKQGNKRTAVEVMAGHIEFLDSRPEQTRQTPVQAKFTASQDTQGDFTEIDETPDGDLPFKRGL